MDRLLIDTNIILDYLLTRTPFCFLVDFLMQGRIKEAVRNVDDTIRKVTVVRNELKQKLHSL